MCLQDLWISQYIEGNQYQIDVPITTGMQLIGPNPRRWSVAMVAANSSLGIGFGFQPFGTNSGFLTNTRNNTQFWSRQMIGNLITKPIFGYTTAASTLSIVECILTAPLEEILSRYNQEFRKANGIESWVPNLPLPPQITQR